MILAECTSRKHERQRPMIRRSVTSTFPASEVPKSTLNVLRSVHMHQSEGNGSERRKASKYDDWKRSRISIHPENMKKHANERLKPEDSQLHEMKIIQCRPCFRSVEHFEALSTHTQRST